MLEKSWKALPQRNTKIKGKSPHHHNNCIKNQKLVPSWPAAFAQSKGLHTHTGEFNSSKPTRPETSIFLLIYSPCGFPHLHWPKLYQTRPLEGDFRPLSSSSFPSLHLTLLTLPVFWNLLTSNHFPDSPRQLSSPWNQLPSEKNIGLLPQPKTGWSWNSNKPYSHWSVNLITCLHTKLFSREHMSPDLCATPICCSGQTFKFFHVPSRLTQMSSASKSCSFFSGSPIILQASLLQHLLHSMIAVCPSSIKLTATLSTGTMPFGAW